MNEANNGCSALIVYGSHAPGGENHTRLASLDGVWRKGFVQGTRHASDDDIGPGNDLIEAWVLEFTRPQADLYSAEYEAWARGLYDIWMKLDSVMGTGTARDSRQWWPEGSNAIAGTAGMKVANIYLSLQRFPDLANRDEQPHPDDEYDLAKLWRQVLTGEKKYDSSHFIALIKDAHPDSFDAMFGDLPDGGRFLERLKRLFVDHQLNGPSMLTPGGQNFYHYVYPLARNARPLEELVELGRKDIAQCAGVLRASGKTDHAAVLEKLTFVADKRENPAPSAAEQAMEEFADDLCYSGPTRPRWHYCLGEACYGIAADYVLKRWLMLFLFQPSPPQPRPTGGLLSLLRLRRLPLPLDLEPSYALWKAGGRYDFDGNTCFVYEVERREG
ncbi:hypothetical protein GAO09_29425 [Rhizobiales bacterium RZME27]|uniref:Uncharacterized protein n=1 Tax=Endobacterium cereale TaxID=2663029 RepID=A0A6A8AJU2_9HYPH|nr:hypothetical protein [Endobacterium cereale]MEB2845685.1 hypothetical protein [Endobacterium cereale]MQY50157.1 hypothetical protein [Endobacterium cereale]